MSKPRPLVALAGNPNTGKTTLFNALTGLRAKVGNYPGVTVERRIGKTRLGKQREVDVIDIPGTYSLVANSADEQIALTALLGLENESQPDVVVMCVDASNVSRGLYLVLQALEFGMNVVVALTMTDEAGESTPDISALSRKLGVPVVPVVVRRSKGLTRLREAIETALGRGKVAEDWKWKPSTALEESIAAVSGKLPPAWPQNQAMALWALMSVTDDDELRGVPDDLRRALRSSNEKGSAVDDEVVCARYQWLDEHVSPLVETKPDRSRTDRIDRVLLNRGAGFLVFLALMFIVFQSLFAWADPAVTAIETLFGWISDGCESVLPPSIARDFLTNGVIAGLGSVVVFLPQILLLFLFIGIMEDSGYMARVAYLMDRIMKSMNLHGRAFVPMMSGFACAVPAILATRTMERRRDRILTMMVTPLMTCSARLPIYTLVIAALFPAGKVFGFFPVQGLLMVSMYLFSTLVALLAAWVMSKTVKPLRGKRLPFVIELPPYRFPRMRDVLRMMWERTSYFLKEAGSVILVCTIVLWALLSFPRNLHNPERDYDTLIESATTVEVAKSLEQERDGELLRASYGGRLGRFIEPAIEPLGFDWKIGVGIIGAFAAREVFISTMGVVYSVGDDVDEDSSTLRERMRSETHSDGRAVYSPLVGLSLMIFFALACQCMSTLAVVKRETGGYKWPAFLFLYMTTLAWVASFLVYQGGRLLGFG